MRADCQIAAATFEDLPEVAAIHVKAWQQAYVGQIPQSYLDSLNPANRQKKWEDIFWSKKEDDHLFLARSERNPVGFIAFGRARDPEWENSGEIYAIYILQHACGQGIGHALFETAIGIMKNIGCGQCYTWVLETNERAIRAYKRWGGRLAPETSRVNIVGDHPVREVAVVFDLTPPS